MLKKFGTSATALQAGLVIACFALTAGMAVAQDVVIDDGAVLVDPIDATDPVWIGGDPIFDENGEEIIWLNDGIGDGEPLGIEFGETTEEESVDPVYVEGEFPESTCGGCEYQFEAGAPETQRLLSAGSDNEITSGDVVRSDANICFDAALYIPLLCDWQRSFAGDQMP